MVTMLQTGPWAGIPGNFIGAVFALACLVLMADATQQKVSSRPNFVFVITDDMDIELGAMTPMVQLKKLVGDAGATFSNAFVTTPLCCPSRSSLFTGRYVHNHGSINNSVSGECSGPGWKAGPEKETFAVHLKKSGYTTFFTGKYLNQYGKDEAGGATHVPPGWSNWIGLIGNSQYYNYSLSINGTKEHHKDNYEKDYLTNIIRNRSLDFLDNRPRESPFFMMLSTPAPHFPFIPEPKYANKFSAIKAPRTPSFNIMNGPDKNWLLRQGPQPLSDKFIEIVDEDFRQRWRTLLTVDDMINDVIKSLETKNILDNTYIIFTSDHGYHLGQFSLPIDKREPYEFDIRVPLLMRGPGIKPGKVVTGASLNIDLASTILDLAGISAPESMDGISLKPLILNEQSSVEKPWGSRVFLTEHAGEGQEVHPTCNATLYDMGGCNPTFNCKCEDSRNNTYACLRTVSDSTNSVFCNWPMQNDFVEYYDLKSDPYQLNNSVQSLPEDIHGLMSSLLLELQSCKGAKQCNQENMSEKYLK